MDTQSAAVRFGLYVELKAKPGRETEVADFLKSAVPLVEAEPGTIDWFALRLDATTFAIFDTFADEDGRDAHLSGKVAAALMQHAPDLLAEPPVIRKNEILART